MSAPSSRLPSLDTPHALRGLHADVCARALDARDARFDGVFFVGILTTGVYCRPVCPARVSHRDRRRFFDSAAGAERAGFRPCLRCRPELAPGRALIDAVPRLADAAAQRIASGALNGQSVAQLARELGVSERHLRRALERELGVSPVELAQTHRLLLAKRLLADTRLSVTDVAFASGFQSLRRFNAAFRAQYRMSPSALRRTPRAARGTSAEQAESANLRRGSGWESCENPRTGNEAAWRGGGEGSVRRRVPALALAGLTAARLRGEEALLGGNGCRRQASSARRAHAPLPHRWRASGTLCVKDKGEADGAVPEREAAGA